MKYNNWRRIFAEQVYKDYRRFIEVNVKAGFFNNEVLRDLDIKFNYMDLRDKGIKRKDVIEILADKHFISIKTVEKIVHIYKEESEDEFIKP